MRNAFWWTVSMMMVVVSASELVDAEPLRIGTTYSSKQSGYLGLDGKDTYLAVLDAGFDLIRLGAYWDEIESHEAVYDFANLDWQIAKAKARAIPIILTVGMKAPRWPEYFIPVWVLRQLRLRRGSEVSTRKQVTEHTLQFIRAVVNRYRHEPAIQYWQVENEPLDHAGPGYWWIGQSFLKREVELVRALDPERRPIVINVATYPNRFLRFLTRFFTQHDPIGQGLALCDILALNVYPGVGYRWKWKTSYYWSRSEERLRYLSAIVREAAHHHKPVWVTELQAEPWEPGQLVHTAKELPPTGRPDMLAGNAQELQSLGVDTILLWGAEYWQFRKIRHGDRQWWEAVLALLKQRAGRHEPRLASR